MGTDRYTCECCGEDIRNDFISNAHEIIQYDENPKYHQIALRWHLELNGNWCPHCLYVFSKDD